MLFGIRYFQALFGGKVIQNVYERILKKENSMQRFHEKIEIYPIIMGNIYFISRHD